MSTNFNLYMMYTFCVQNIEPLPAVMHTFCIRSVRGVYIHFVYIQFKKLMEMGHIVYFLYTLN